jgi:threonyl-tRNA synthetase
MWDHAERVMMQVLNEIKARHGDIVTTAINPGEGAFYGPKFEYVLRDAIGREWQVSTFQFDFNLPERFDLTYTGADGQPHQPYMVHRALFGSIERFFGILVEHYAGAFPLWLAPEQVRLLPLTDKQHELARGLAEQFGAEDFRVTVDERNEKIGAKIRAAQLEKIPYMLIIGPKEAEQGLVSVRHRTAGDQGVMTPAAFMERLRAEGRPGGQTVAGANKQQEQAAPVPTRAAAAEK